MGAMKFGDTDEFAPQTYQGQAGGLLGMLRAALVQQYGGISPQTLLADQEQQPSDAPATDAQPGQDPAFAGASTPSRQLSSRRVPIYAPMQYGEGPTDPYSPYDPQSYDGQGAVGLLGEARRMMPQAGVQPDADAGSNSEYDPRAYRDQKSGLVDRLSALQQQQAAYQPTKPIMDPRRFELAQGIARVSQKLGINPEDLATAISYETAGTFNPWKAGPVTQYGQHRGLIQWDEPQAKEYGVTKDSSITQQMEAVGRYLSKNGVQPNMGLRDIYSAINAGHVGLYDKSDSANGGAPGTVADKVDTQMEGHKVKAAALMREFSQTLARQPGLAVPAVFPDRAAPLFPQ